MKHGYTLDNAWAKARERLAFLESVLNPHSFQHLEALGVGEGWHCLDVGAGGGSVSEWLCRKFGSAGHVVATDIDTRFLDLLPCSNLEVRRHNVTRETLPKAEFDLVHCRAPLVHLAERERALENMVAALKPGGWLLVEEPDSASSRLDPRFRGADRFAKGLDAGRHVLSMAGYDIFCGRNLYGDVHATGLIDLDAAGHVHLIRAHSPYALFYKETFTQLRDRVVTSGKLSDEEMDQFLELHDDEGLVWISPTWMAVWGRKPG